MKYGLQHESPLRHETLQRKHFLELRMLGLPFAARKTSLRYNERKNPQGTQLLFDKRREVEKIILTLNNFSFVKTMLLNNLY